MISILSAREPDPNYVHAVPRNCSSTFSTAVVLPVAVAEILVFFKPRMAFILTRSLPTFVRTNQTHINRGDWEKTLFHALVAASTLSNTK
jgi:hypothetical protein